MVTRIDQNEPAQSADLPKYRGFAGAFVYGLFLAGILIGLAALSYGFIVFATGNQVLGFLAFTRICQMAAMTGIVAAFSRWLCGGESNSLYSPKMIKGDLGGVVGWVMGLILAGFLTQGAIATFFIKADETLLGQSPAIVGPTYDGGKFDLKEKKGKVVLIDFWATWCQPCVAELPIIHEAYEKYHDKGLEVVSISLDFDKESLSRFLKKSPHSWPQIYFDRDGQRGFDNPLAKEFGIDSIPRIWLVNQDGKVVSTNLRGDDISQQIAILLGEPPSFSIPRNVSLFLLVEWLIKGMLFSPIALFWGMVLGLGFICSVLEAVVRRTFSR